MVGPHFHSGPNFQRSVVGQPRVLNSRNLPEGCLHISNRHLPKRLLIINDGWEQHPMLHGSIIFVIVQAGLDCHCGGLQGKQVPASHPIVAVDDGRAGGKSAPATARTPAPRVAPVSQGEPSYAKPTAAFVTRVTGPATPTTPSGFHYVPN